MFEKFTEGAIKVIMLAQEEARRMGHNFVGTEQLLLGVIGQRHGIGGRALSQLNVTLKKTRKEIEKYIGRGTGFVASEIPFTPRRRANSRRGLLLPRTPSVWPPRRRGCRRCPPCRQEEWRYGPARCR